MKQLLWIILLCNPLLSKSQSNYAENGIRWVEGMTWDQVKEKAKKENKFIFVDAYATWCGPCKKMDVEVYPDKNVGEALNQQFVSVKVQMDQTPKDDDRIKNWYSVSKQFTQQYSIDGFPSFLFFNSDGKLVHKALGFKDISAFLELAKDALTDPEERYKKSLHKYQNGIMDYESMAELALQVKSKKNMGKAFEIAKVFKEKFLDKLPDEAAFQKSYLNFVMNFSNLVNSNDRYFSLFYKHPDIADSITGTKNSRSFAFFIIRKDEILDKIYKDGRPIHSVKPDWKRYKKSIKRKFGEKYVNKIFPDEQINFYLASKDWKNYVKYVNDKIKKAEPKANGKGLGEFGDATTLNSYAWNLFLHCSDNKSLEKGLPWAELAISLETSVYNALFYDTKANLLYKLGKVQEAIEIEGKAVSIFSKLELEGKQKDEIIDEFKGNIKKMKAGLPTWPVPEGKKDPNP